MTIQLHPVSQLRAHEARLSLPQQPANPATVASVAEIGIQTSLKVTRARNAEGWENGEELYVVDGMDRLEAARAAMLAEVPVEIIPDDMVQTTLLHSLLARKHLTKFALAYVAFPFVQAAVDEARVRMVACQKRGDEDRKSPGVPVRNSRTEIQAKTMEELSEKLGVARRVLFLARNVHGYFAKEPALRGHFEPGILGGDYGETNIERAIITFGITSGKEKDLNNEEEYWFPKIKGIVDKRKWSAWETTSPGGREFVAKTTCDGVAENFPEEVKALLLETLLAEKRIRRHA